MDHESGRCVLSAEGGLELVALKLGARGLSGSAEGADLDSPELIAYRIDTAVKLDLAPASQHRAWMDATSQQFARRCLPLLMANQSGWFLSTPHALSVTWNGGAGLDAVRIEYADASAPRAATSHFGHGILTWHIPFVFRTSPGWNLLARGPANWPKPGIMALEGLVETDWAVASFTMNWLMTTPGQTVTFEPGEPVCMIVPQRRGEIESFRPLAREIPDDPALAAGYATWRDGRNRFNAQLHVPGSPESAQGWQKDYFRGGAPSGLRSTSHQTRLKLAEFKEDRDGICPPPTE